MVRYKVIVFGGDVRPEYVRSLGQYESVEEADEAIAWAGYASARSPGQWAIVIPADDAPDVPPEAS